MVSSLPSSLFNRAIMKHEGSNGVSGSISKLHSKLMLVRMLAAAIMRMLMLRMAMATAVRMRRTRILL